jgi:hypothetical protein
MEVKGLGAGGGAVQFKNFLLLHQRKYFGRNNFELPPS